MQTYKSFGYQRLFKILTFLACFSFVSWQCYKSVDKYLQEPRSTLLKIDFAKDWPTPTFTVCSSEPINDDVLEGCSRSGWSERYLNKGAWVGSGTDENCTDPKILYENAMKKAEEFIHYAKVKYFFNPTVSKIQANSSLWKPVHAYVTRHGRCYQLQIPPEMQEFGIREIELFVFWPQGTFKRGNYMRIFFHAPGEFLTSREPKPFGLYIKEQVAIELDHQIDNVLKLGNENCVQDPMYNRDTCVNEVLFKQSMETLGCTSPWGLNQDHICTNDTIGKEAHELYKNYFTKKLEDGFLEKCQRSCQTMKIRIGSAGNINKKLQRYVNGKPSGSLHIKMHEVITVTQDQYSYNWLNLLAEVGGYVGLFLGLSVYQVTDLVDRIYQLSFIEKIL